MDREVLDRTAIAVISKIHWLVSLAVTSMVPAFAVVTDTAPTPPCRACVSMDGKVHLKIFIYIFIYLFSGLFMVVIHICINMYIRHYLPSKGLSKRPGVVRRGHYPSGRTFARRVQQHGCV